MNFLYELPTSCFTSISFVGIKAKHGIYSEIQGKFCITVLYYVGFYIAIKQNVFLGFFFK